MKGKVVIGDTDQIGIKAYKASNKGHVRSGVRARVRVKLKWSSVQ